MMRKIEPQIAFLMIIVTSVIFLWFLSAQVADITKNLEKMDSNVNKVKGNVSADFINKKDIKAFFVGDVSDKLVSIIGWDIYVNEKYGYSMMYPKNWNFKESSSKKKVVFYFDDEDYKKCKSNDYLNVNMYIDLDINRYINEYRIYNEYSDKEEIEIMSISNIDLNFLTAKRIQIGNKNRVNREMTFVSRADNTAFILSREEVECNKEIINTIISTFRINDG